jgi:hypothetical protein
MPVEMIIDQWNPSKRRYRTETFCYGPISCPLYESGPVRKVPGRHGMTYTEEDWVDVEAIDDSKNPDHFDVSISSAMEKMMLAIDNDH